VSLPPWVPPIETKPAPMPLLLVQAFVNSYEADTDTDLLREPGSARDWFAAAGLLAAGAGLVPDELRVAREVRESIRSLLTANAGGSIASARALEPLTTLASGCEPRLRIGTSGDVQLEAQPGPGLRAGWLRLLLIIRDAQLDHTWQRLKACENDECGWAFYDRSHSRRGRWCDMAVCGNRMKNRSLRTRQRHARPALGES
jgi:predicted RNA-binding Zn ribbon-like protein